MQTKRLVTLELYNPAWIDAFNTESANLVSVFGDNLITIHHIGSTAVSGIQAKPIVDMLPVVWDIEPVEELNDVMIALGYVYRGEHGIPGRRYFRKGSDLNHTHHVHVYQTGQAEIARHLLFRDYMRACPDKAQAYEALKRELAVRYHEDTAKYTDGKSDFVHKMNEEAVVWQREGQRPLFTLSSARLKLIALSLPQLESCLQDPSLLASNLNLDLEDGVFNATVRQATSIKVSKMRLVPSAKHPWYTYWLIVEQETNRGIGSIGFKGEPDMSGKVEIGYGITPAKRGLGYMTEAASALTQWGLAQPQCTAVFAMTDPYNIPSHRVLQKIGMKRIGEKKGEWQWELKRIE